MDAFPLAIDKTGAQLWFLDMTLISHMDENFQLLYH